MIGLGISCPGDPGCPGGTQNPGLLLGPPDVFSGSGDVTEAPSPVAPVNPIAYDSQGNPIYPSGITAAQLGTAPIQSGCPSGYTWTAQANGIVMGPGGQMGTCMPGTSLIPGISNTALAIGGAAVFAFVIALSVGGGRR